MTINQIAKKKPIVLLDLDDTLFDFKKAEKRAISDTFRQVGVEPDEAVITRYSQINQRNWELLEEGVLTREQVLLGRFETLFDELGTDASTVDAQRIYEYELSQGHYFMPYAEEMIKELYRDNRLFICTNGTSRVQKGRIKSSGIADYFEDIFISEELRENKPSREYFLECFRRIPGFKQEMTLMVGDSLTSDIRGGINAGVKTCWYNPKGKSCETQYKPDYEIASLKGLAPLLQDIFN